MTGVGPQQAKRVYIGAVLLFFGLPVLALVLASAVVTATMVTNNLRLTEWKKDLFELAPPSGARVVASGSNFGLLGVNSNHCDKRAWIMLETSSSADEIERYYAGHLETTSVWVSVSVREASHVRVVMFEHGDAAGWDPRCH